MKKLLVLLVVSLFFTGFTSKEENGSNFPPTLTNMLQQSLPPTIGSAIPENRTVVVIEGDRASFSIGYQPIEGVTATIKKEHGDIGENCFFSYERGIASVTIVNIKTSDQGRYIITLTNEAGSTSISFNVYVAPRFNFLKPKN